MQKIFKILSIIIVVVFIFVFIPIVVLLPNEFNLNDQLASGFRFTKPYQPLPERFAYHPEVEFEGQILSYDKGNNLQCKKEPGFYKPTKIQIFSSKPPGPGEWLGGWSRSAIICGDKYWIETHSHNYFLHGPFITPKNYK